MNSKNFSSEPTSPIGLGKMIIVGLVAGLVATGVKTLCEIVSPPRPPGVPSPLGNALDAASIGLTGHPIPEATKSFAEPAVHFLFGMAAGVAYVALARKIPVLRAGYGALFGFSFWLLAHEIALPLMDLSPTPAQMTLWEQGNELVSHIIFGATLEFVRRLGLRKWA